MKRKKLIAVFTCSFLTLGGGTLLAVQSASKNQVRQVRADDPVDLGTIIFTGVLPGSTDSAITFYTLQENEISSGWSAMNYVSGTVELNNTDISSNAKFQKANVHDYYFPISVEGGVNDDDILTVEAVFSGEDEGVTYTFEVQRFQVQWDGTSWNFLNQDVGTVAFSSVHGASSKSGLYIKGRETYSVFPQAWDPAQYCSYYPVSGSGYVTLNGVELNNVRLRKVPEIQPGYYWYLELNADANEDDVIRVGGNWAGCGFAFTITEYAKTWNGSLWMPMQRDAGTITFSEVRSLASTIEHVYTYASDNDIPFSGSWDYPFTPVDSDSGVFVDGVKQGDSAIKKVDIGVYIDGELIPIYYFHVAGVQENSVIEVKGTFSGLSLDGDNYTFTVPSFSRQWDGSAWGYVNEDAGAVTLIGVDANPAASSATGIQFISEGTNSVPTSWDTKYYPQTGASVTLNGNDVTSGAFFKKPGAQGYFLEGFGTASVGSKVTVSGEFAGQSGDRIYHFTVVEYTREWNGTIWTPVNVDAGSVKLVSIEANPAASSAAGIQFISEGTNDVPANWDDKYYPQEGASVKLDGNDVTSNAFFKKPGAQGYFLEGFGTAQEGSVVVVSGEFAGQSGEEIYHFTVEESMAKFDGEVWQSLEQYKAAAKTALENYLNEEDYLPDDWDLAEEIIVNGKDNIDVCVDFNDVDSMLENFEGHLDDVPTRTQRAQDAAADVDELISAITDINRRNYDEEKAKVEAARAAYNALSDEAKGYVEKLNLLQGAEGRLADIEAAIVVDNKINAIGTVTLESEAAITEARVAYNALNANQNRFVLSLDTLVAAEARLAELKAQKAHVEEVEGLIDAIGNVDSTKASKDKIDAAYNAYQALTAEEKAMVSNKATLDSALATFDNAVGISRQAALDDVEEYYYGINMKKYSQENQERINQLYADVQETIQAQEYSDNLTQIVNEFKAAVEAIPQKKAAAKKGCGGSVVATSVVLSTLALAGLGLLSIKKRKED